MLAAIAALLVCQLAGEAVVRAAGLPVPGPVVVGVVQHLELLSGAGLRLVAVVVFTTLITLAVTALVFAALARLLHVDDLAPGKPETEERS